MNTPATTPSPLLPRPRGPALLAWYLGLYGRIAGQYIKVRLSYRADFWISTLGMVMSIVPGLAGTLILFRTIPRLAGWNRDELLFLYAFSLLSLCLLQIVFDHLWQLRNHIQTGTFIKYYFKPLNMLFYYTSEMVDLKGFTQLIVGLGLLVWSGSNLALSWTVWRILGLVVLLGGASLIMTGLLLAASSTAFWIVNSFSVLSLVNRLREYARYPLGIFSDPARIIFSSLIPLGFIAFFPASWVLDPVSAGWFPWLTLPVGMACFGLGTLVWSVGVRSWSGTGS